MGAHTIVWTLTKFVGAQIHAWSPIISWLRTLSRDRPQITWVSEHTVGRPGIYGRQLRNVGVQIIRVVAHKFTPELTPISQTWPRVSQRNVGVQIIRVVAHKFTPELTPISQTWPRVSQRNVGAQVVWRWAPKIGTHSCASMHRSLDAPIFAPPSPPNFSRASFASRAKFFKIFSL